MRKTIMLTTGLAVGLVLTATVRAEDRGTRPAKVQGVSLRAASTTPVEGYDRVGVDGQTYYISPQTLLAGDQVTSVRTTDQSGATNMALSLTDSAAAQLGATKNLAPNAAVFVDGQLITVGGFSMQNGSATLTGLVPTQAERIARLLTRDSLSPTAAAITVAPVSAANGEYVFDAYAQNVSGLRTYQVKLVPTGGDAGALTLADIHIDEQRADYVFAGSEAIKAADAGGSRLGGTLFDGTVDVTAPAYLGTWVFVASPDAAGTFTIQVVSDPDSFLANRDNATISSGARGATVTIGGVPSRINR